MEYIAKKGHSRLLIIVCATGYDVLVPLSQLSEQDQHRDLSFPPMTKSHRLIVRLIPAAHPMNPRSNQDQTTWDTRARP